ncbi:hypothetical protein C8R46DRAFT_1299939 [Mycena filopes]|nr:hypothetical protein C8R46DRAFT_1299939 [Mycena filopes]
MDIDNTPTRVEELWFFDGGLVVQAEQSLYRVSGGILAARSPVFKDMLSFTQPSDAETIEGCPVVRLPDSAVDVTCFFRAIFDSSFFEPHPNKVHLEDIVSILHLSNKYSVEYLLRRALVHLSSHYPTTLSGYDTNIYGASTSSLLPRGEENIQPGHVIGIQIAREVNALWILPAAFYCLAAIGEADIERILGCVAYKARSAKLSDGDRVWFLKSSIQISQQGHHILSCLGLPRVVPGCVGGGCALERLHTLAEVQNSLTDLEASLADDPLDLFLPLDTLLPDCCQTCRDFAQTAIQDARQALWDRLPALCGLPPWKELEEMKHKALEE